MKPPALLKHKPPLGVGCGKGKVGILSRFAAAGQLEAVNSGLPLGSLISVAHIFLIAVTTLAGIDT